MNPEKWYEIKQMEELVLELIWRSPSCRSFANQLYSEGYRKADIVRTEMAQEIMEFLSSVRECGYSDLESELVVFLGEKYGVECE